MYVLIYIYTHCYVYTHKQMSVLVPSNGYAARTYSRCGNTPGAAQEPPMAHRFHGLDGGEAWSAVFHGDVS